MRLEDALRGREEGAPEQLEQLKFREEKGAEQMQGADKTENESCYQCGKSSKSDKYIQNFSNIVVKCLFTKYILNVKKVESHKKENFISPIILH